MVRSHLAGRSDDPEAPRRSFFDPLVEEEVLSNAQAIEVMELQQSSRPMLGQMAIRSGLLTEKQVRKVLEHQLQNPEIRFGRAAVELGLLDEAEVERLARDQVGSAMHIDEAIAKVLACEADHVAELRARFEEQPQGNRGNARSPGGVMLRAGGMAKLDRRRFVRSAGAGAGLGLAAGWLPAVFSAEARGGGARRDAFSDLLGTLRQLEESYATPGAGADPQGERAETHRYLMHLLAAAHELFLENDPERPRAVPLETPSRRLMGGHPDALVHFAPLRADRGYRIRGVSVEGEVYRSFTVYGGQTAGSWSDRVLAHRAVRTAGDPAGATFELQLAPGSADSADPGAPLPLAPGAQGVIVRQYSMNPDARTFRARGIAPAIEPLDDPGPSPEPSPSEIERRLRAVTDFVRDQTVMRFALPPERQPEWIGHGWNRFGPPDVWHPEHDGGGWGCVDMTRSAARFRIGPDEALVLSGTLPECAFASVVLTNHWMQSLDWTGRRVSLNRRQMHLGPDGTYRIVVAHRDPGLPDWLDTGGRPEGRIDWRVLLPGTPPSRPLAEVVPWAALRG